jgi:uncharacterized protein YjbJ (UPF0337 family)
MNDVLEGNWKQIRGHAKEWWGKLTDDDVNLIQGKRDILLGLLQEKYGYTKVQANSEISRRLAEFDRENTGHPVGR